MKPSLIKTIIRRKVNKWADTIEDKELRAAVKKDTVVMGGAICSLLQNETPKDYDVYFRNTDLAIKVAAYYYKRATGDDLVAIDDPAEAKGLSHYAYSRDEPKGIGMFIKSSGKVEGEAAKDDRTAVGAHNIEELPDEVAEELFGTLDENEQVNAELQDPDEEKAAKKKNVFEPKYITENAITLSDGIQIVLRFCGEPEYIINYYDYEHCKMWFQCWDGVLKTPEFALETLLNKRLVYTGSKYPICSLFRMRKFMARGWRINAGQIVKMAYQISHLDLNNIEVLRDQLIGCDHAYFMWLIADLQSKVAEDPEAVKTYLVEMIDKYFG